jgi:SAM-dependent methyltransferase
VASPELHRDRARAESFGSATEQYDRFRSGYPDTLLDDLAALRPSRVLDIGCGTGKVAVPLVARGLSVLGIEVDPRMASSARGHGIQVEVGAFETWDDAGRRFDLITCGAAWHWIDPVLGIAKAAEVLRPGGTLARFWHVETAADDVMDALLDVYRRHAPELHTADRPRSLSPDHDGFTPFESSTYQWERTLTADEWVGRASTYSNHQRLEPARLAALQQALRNTINNLGGIVHLSAGIQVEQARRL